MADVAAKDGSQETAVTLAGLLLGLIIAPLVEGNYGLIWILFFMFTAAHLFANYRAVRGLVMDVFNRQRLSLVVERYIYSAGRDVITPTQVSHLEWPIWFAHFESGCYINFGAPVSPLLHLLPSTSSAPQTFLHMLSSCPYFICLRLSHAVIPFPLAGQGEELHSHLDLTFDNHEAVMLVSDNPTIDVLLRKDADHETCILAYAAALVTRRTLQEHRDATIPIGQLRRLLASRWQILLPGFVSQLQAQGWHTHRSLLGPGPWRYLPLAQHDRPSL